MKSGNLIKYISLLFLNFFVLTSCSESMLDEKLYSQIGSENLSDKEGAELLTKGIYGYARYFSYYGGNNWLMCASANTDDFFCNWGGTPDTGWGGAMNFLNMDAGHAMAKTNWDKVYNLISQCNEVINSYSKSEDATIQQYVAESHFWRAYAYDKLYHLFGTVPIVTGNEDISNGIARATTEEMEAFIKTEYEDALGVLPATYSSSDYGRPTKWAVEAAMSRFYLNKKDWETARKYAWDIIEKGGFELLKNYQAVFGENQNNEVLLAINNIAEANHGNKYVALSLESTVKSYLGITGVSASNGYGMSVPFFRTFDPVDKRIAPYDATTGEGIAVSGILYNSDGSPLYGTSDAPKTVEEQLGRVITFKWPVQQNIPLGEDASLNVPLFRLGETYLTYAEAENELNEVGEARKYVNLIRARAGLGDLPENISQDEMRTAILNERGWELYHEGFRREDLVRGGKLLEKVNEKYRYYLGKDMAWKDDTDRLLEPIPTDALLLNHLLKQNHGY